MADKPVRTDKATAVAEMTGHFKTSTATVLTEYRGLTVAQLKNLRRTLGAETTYAVTKNTLAKRAAAEAGITGLDDLFSGPTALAFVGGDVVEAAKSLRDFAKAHPFLVIKGGVFEGKALTRGEINKLADLESREVLLGQAGRRPEGHAAVTPPHTLKRRSPRPPAHSGRAAGRSGRRTPPTAAPTTGSAKSAPPRPLRTAPLPESFFFFFFFPPPPPFFFFFKKKNLARPPHHPDRRERTRHHGEDQPPTDLLDAFKEMTLPRAQ